MELKIISPGENGFLKEIQWNQEEVKAWVAARVQDYKNIAYTEDQVKDMKKDRADLNKLRTAFESERKRLKKVCMEPSERLASLQALWDSQPVAEQGPCGERAF